MFNIPSLECPIKKLNEITLSSGFSKIKKSNLKLYFSYVPCCNFYEIICIINVRTNVAEPVTKVINFSVLRDTLLRRNVPPFAANFYFSSRFISTPTRRFLFYAGVTAKKK